MITKLNEQSCLKVSVKRAMEGAKKQATVATSGQTPLSALSKDKFAATTTTTTSISEPL
jgi:hypothetical protein